MSRATKTKTADQPPLVIDNEKGAVPAVQKNAPPPAQIVTGPDALFAVIERASRDTSVDLDRMQKLIDMHKEMKSDNARGEYDCAMSAAQAEMKRVKTNKRNEHTKSSYASYAAMDKEIRPIYTKHGFSVSFDTGDSGRSEEVRVLATVAHRAGHREEYKIDVPSDGKGAKDGAVMTKTHAVGSAISYGRRYLHGMIWNLAIGNDDDGNDAAGVAKGWVDIAIQHLNSMNPDKAELESWRAANEKDIGVLKKKHPEQFERFQIAYSNAAEAAGIKKEEPRRGDKTKASTATSPHSEPSQGGAKLAREDDQGAGSVRTSEASGTPPTITDVIEFDTFATAREFLDFSSGFMDDPKRTAAEAQQWYDHFKEKIDGYLKHEFPGKPKSWIRDSMTDTFAQFVKITSAAG